MPDIVPSARAAVTVGPPAQEEVENMSDSEDTDLEEEDVPPASEDAETADDEEPLVGAAGCGYPARHPHRSTLIYCIFYLLGMGTLLPWNFFITADSYWNYKFRDVQNATVPTDLQYNFFGYLSVASMVPNTIFLTLNAVFGHKLKQQAKLVASLSLVIVFFIITTVLVPIDSDDWQNTFFAVTMVMVVILNAGAAVFQGGLFGLAAQFPARYLSAVISGQALGAVFACVARIVSIAVSAGGDDPDSAAVNSALVYFILADVTLVISVAAYIWMSRMSFYEYYTRASRLTSGTDEDSMARPGSSQQAPTISVWKIFLKIKWYALSVCLVFVVTLALFPAVTAKIIPQDGLNYSTWTHDYFVPVCCFLLFNGCDYIGRILGGFTVWPKMNHWYLVLGFTLLRFAFFPLFMHCDNGDKQQLDVVFDEDWYYIVFMVVFGLSNGYLSTLCMIYGPSLVEPEEQNTASSMMAAFLGLGLCGGALLSNLAISLL